MLARITEIDVSEPDMSRFRTSFGVPVYGHLVIDPEDAFNRALGANIRALRAKATQASIAEAVGISRTALVLIEHGKQRVHAFLLVRLAQALGTPIEALLPATATTPAAVMPRVEAPARVRDWVEQVVSGADLGGGGHGQEPT